ncbi:excalibur calcium-binding domain-containing protein [Nocardia transvalensis]|uniref:excalibur calcium-binding domain-containing protein n=1 Tax=Nocardia transvalensis TaxID=37333 RepID=UPI0018943FC6|nr:excalibur calcium-binding domain-containing protein [Nocardia transvalensis]MBF6329063.1 excalibur calcium-binding domain-containing protein [Nocardia transvalensis]
MKISHIRRLGPAVAAAGLLAAGTVAAPMAAATPDSSAAPSAGGSGWTVDSDGEWQRPPADSERSTAYPYYATCTDMIAAGVAPLYSSQPGYRVQLDANGNGMACEPWEG